jgi:hypothetical protein
MRYLKVHTGHILHSYHFIMYSHIYITEVLVHRKGCHTFSHKHKAADDLDTTMV